MRIEFDTDDLRPLVEAVIAEVLSRANQLGLDDARLAYPEAEAAALLGIAAHQLRDARLRGEIVPTRLGGRVGYSRTALVTYLANGEESHG